ncbi:cytochrome P450 71A9-like [Ipomoea triloba]|uniref:cytochrome P450 71A9-like n=1 Tax=Ipomoea triloba TaxID=35885 RepID=UPI00125D424C|nr:cytochrome P450 71A9-like [Ipomoea triloba]
MVSQISAALITFVLLFFLRKIFVIKKKGRSAESTKKLPPGPKKIPIIGNLHQLAGKSLHHSLHQLSQQYGEIMSLQLGSIPTLVVSSADAAREIFRDHDLVFSGRPPLYAATKISFNCSSTSFAPYGEYWREVRKILVTELLSTKRVQDFEAVRDAEVCRMIDRITACSATSTVVDLSSLALSLSNNVVRCVAFGNKGDGDDDETMKFNEILHQAQHLMGEPNLADVFPRLAWINKVNGLDARLEKTFKDIDSFFNKVMEEHLAEHSRHEHDEEDEEDIVHTLLRIQKDPNQTSMPLTNQHIKGVLVDVFIAGSDTSAATIIWTMAELIKNPNAMRKAQLEVRQLMNGKEKVSESDLPQLKYLKMVIKEALRFHPPAPLLVPRETTDKCTVGGYDIPAKTRVFINAVAIGRDRRAWEKPGEFWPERFWESEVDYRGNHYELIPFGAGRRGCPGMNFAAPLVELAVANLLYRFEWRLPAGMGVEDVDMDEAFGITIHKKAPLCLVASILPN